MAYIEDGAPRHRWGLARLAQLLDRGKDLLGPRALAVGVGLEDPADDAVGVDEHGGGVRDVDAIVAPSSVADAELVQEHAFLVGEEGEAAIQPIPYPA